MVSVTHFNVVSFQESLNLLNGLTLTINWCKQNEKTFFFEIYPIFHIRKKLLACQYVLHQSKIRIWRKTMTLLKKIILFGLKKHMAFSIIKLKTLVQLFCVSYLFLSGFWFRPSIIIQSILSQKQILVRRKVTICWNSVFSLFWSWNFFVTQLIYVISIFESLLNCVYDRTISICIEKIQIVIRNNENRSSQYDVQLLNRDDVKRVDN